MSLKMYRCDTYWWSLLKIFHRYIAFRTEPNRNEVEELFANALFKDKGISKFFSNIDALFYGGAVVLDKLNVRHTYFNIWGKRRLAEILFLYPLYAAFKDKFSPRLNPNLFDLITINLYIFCNKNKIESKENIKEFNHPQECSFFNFARKFMFIEKNSKFKIRKWDIYAAQRYLSRGNIYQVIGVKFTIKSGEISLSK